MPHDAIELNYCSLERATRFAVAFDIALLREQYGMGTIEVRIMRPRPKLN